MSRRARRMQAESPVRRGLSYDQNVPSYPHGGLHRPVPRTIALSSAMFGALSGSLPSTVPGMVIYLHGSTHKHGDLPFQATVECGVFHDGESGWPEPKATHSWRHGHSDERPHS